MELTVYFHRIYDLVPWNPLNFHGINGKNLWHFMNFHNFLLLVYLPSTAMETLKTPSEYSVDFNRGFQGVSMANLKKGLSAREPRPLLTEELTIKLELEDLDLILKEKRLPFYV